MVAAAAIIADPDDFKRMTSCLAWLSAFASLKPVVCDLRIIASGPLPARMTDPRSFAALVRRMKDGGAPGRPDGLVRIDMPGIPRLHEIWLFHSPIITLIPNGLIQKVGYANIYWLLRPLLQLTDIDALGDPIPRCLRASLRLKAPPDCREVLRPEAQWHEQVNLAHGAGSSPPEAAGCTNCWTGCCRSSVRPGISAARS